MKISINRSSTKQGVASLYVVLFTTILFGVITLSFVRIILSERIQGSNDDLSRSAYDSALAGVEDAKQAISRCLKDNDDDLSACADSLFGGNCEDFKLKEYLYRDLSDTEVKIQESTSNQSEQAYTCVVMSNKVADYRATLTSDTRTRVVPIGINSDLSDIAHIQFNWYSDVNHGDAEFNFSANDSLPVASNKTVPPTISLSLIVATDAIWPSEFDNSTSEHQSSMLLVPSDADTATNTISVAEIRDSADSDIRNTPFLIKCEAREDFACKVDLNVDLTGKKNAMLVVSLPYGDTISDFAVSLTDASGETIDFENVQISVDSTGRANQLVRRVETRLDPADMFFPYPQFDMELDGTPSDDSIKKNRWFTANCWTEEGVCDDNG